MTEKKKYFLEFFIFLFHFDINRNTCQEKREQRSELQRVFACFAIIFAVFFRFCKHFNGFIFFENFFKKGIDKSKTLCYNQQRRRENAINDVGA